jgi:hypothetical protein
MTTARSDPVRRDLERLLAETDARVRGAASTVVRFLAGGVPLRSERVATARAELSRAIHDRTVARELLRELHAVDGETVLPGRPS